MALAAAPIALTLLACEAGGPSRLDPPGLPDTGTSDAGESDDSPPAIAVGAQLLDASLFADTSVGPQPEAGVCLLPQCPPGGPCPDLIVDLADLQSSTEIVEQTFAPTDCALVEQCIGAPGLRTLLKFDTGTVNVGTADVVLGSPVDNACFVWSECHMHYHFQNYATYTLYDDAQTTVVAVGRKQAFCLEDVVAWSRDVPPPPVPSVPFTCSNQGIHIGYEDIYPADLPCQWIDITGLPSGNYWLVVEVNAEHVISESDYANNTATVPITIP